MRSVEIFEWKFTPADYFEQEISITCNGHLILVADGVARAEVDSERYATDPELRQQLHDAINNRLLAIQLLTHQPYTLSKSTRRQEREDGTGTIFVEPESGRIVFRGGTPDIRITDPNGNVILDTRQDRLTRKKEFGERIAIYRPRDATLDTMMRSYQAAATDPANELVHLYEIFDALKTKFRKPQQVEVAIGVADWRRFEQMCNERELSQSRHRGQSLGALRDATDAELNEAREIARRMIEGYLTYLEGQEQAGGSGAGP